VHDNTGHKRIPECEVHIVENPPPTYIWIDLRYCTWYSKTFVDKDCTAPPPAGAPTGVGHPENNTHQLEKSTSLLIQQIRAQIVLTVGHPESITHQSETSTALPVQQIRALIALSLC
jgi:hypothetical protein